MPNLPLERTLALVETALPEVPCRILEIGCGDGELAHLLGDAGHLVVGLDADPAAVEAARRRGVDARHAEFPDDDDDGPYDAILFTRSLHHVHRLQEGIEKARELTTAKGILVVEDWAWDEVDARTVAWMNDAARRFAGRDGWFVDWDVDATLDDWLHEHNHHGLHGREVMADAVKSCFEVELEASEPYFYRYVARQPASEEESEALTRESFRSEQDLIERGEIRALGWRLTARAIGTNEDAWVTGKAP